MPVPDEEHFHVVVVGSGFGGAVSAYRLAPTRTRTWCVLVLERGQPYPPGSFPRTPRQMREAFWDPGTGKHGLYEYWRFKDLDMMCASGLGGGSLIYSNVMIPKDRGTFVKEDLADGGRESWPFDREELEPHYDARARDAVPAGLPGDRALRVDSEDAGLRGGRDARSGLRRGVRRSRCCSRRRGRRAGTGGTRPRATTSTDGRARPAACAASATWAATTARRTRSTSPT